MSLGSRVSSSFPANMSRPAGFGGEMMQQQIEIFPRTITQIGG